MSDVGARTDPVIDSQPADNIRHKPGSRMPLLSARPAVVTFPETGHSP